MKKNRILITAGGTATAWHICETIRQYYADDFIIHLSDMYDAALVPAAIYAQRFHKVPPILAEGYREVMYELLAREQIDIVVPLIDHDLFIFPEDDENLRRLGIWSTGAPLNTARTLADKRAMFVFLQAHDLPTPRVCHLSEVEAEKDYVLKPARGFGTKGFRRVRGKDVAMLLAEGDIIQEECTRTPESFEITAEVYQESSFVKIFCRERIETKAGVCTKMRRHEIPEIETYIRRLVSLLPCPTAFCGQFLCHQGQWNMVDCNLRLPAGTAMATASGFQLTRALLAHLLGKTVDERFFQVNRDVKTVLRVFQEVTVQ